MLASRSNRISPGGSYQAPQLHDALRNCGIFIVSIVRMQEIDLNCEDAAESCVREHLDKPLVIA
jgi:hypothetical protein